MLALLIDIRQFCVIAFVVCVLAQIAIGYVYLKRRPREPEPSSRRVRAIRIGEQTVYVTDGESLWFGSRAVVATCFRLILILMLSMLSASVVSQGFTLASIVGFAAVVIVGIGVGVRLSRVKRSK